MSAEIPGLFGSRFGFRNVVPRLTEAGYRVIVIEPLGIGSSARPEGSDYSLTAQADRIAVVLDTLGVHAAKKIRSQSVLRGEVSAVGATPPDDCRDDVGRLLS